MVINKNHINNFLVAVIIMGIFIALLSVQFLIGDYYCEEGNCTICEKPKNPYREETGHFAGYEWAKNRGLNLGECSGNSDSFIDGCSEYVNQIAYYYKYCD